MSTNLHSVYTRKRKLTGKEPEKVGKTNKMN